MTRLASGRSHMANPAGLAGAAGFKPVHRLSATRYCPAKFMRPARCRRSQHDQETDSWIQRERLSESSGFSRTVTPATAARSLTDGETFKLGTGLGASHYAVGDHVVITWNGYDNRGYRLASQVAKSDDEGMQVTPPAVEPSSSDQDNAAQPPSYDDLDPHGMRTRQRLH